MHKGAVQGSALTISQPGVLQVEGNLMCVQTVQLECGQPGVVGPSAQANIAATCLGASAE